MNRCPVLVERDAELRALTALVAEGAPRAAVVTGEAGTGKSRLVQELAAALPAGWSAQTVRAPVALPAPPRARQVVVVLEDAQSLEPAAVGALPALLDDLAAQPVVLVLAYRLGVHPAGSAEMRALAAVVRDPRILETRLMPLSPEGVERMAAAMGRYAAGDLHRRTGGNPFWAEEILRTGRRLPWTVVETVQLQVEALPAAAGELARALAVADDPLPAPAAARLVGELDTAWAPLLAAGLAHADGAVIRLRHALVGEAIAAGLGPEARAGWHGRLAAALAGESVEPERLAHHWAQAGAVERAAAVARAAAADLRARGATRRAFRCYELALRRPPAGAAGAALFEAAAMAAAQIGEYDAMRAWVADAERLYRRAGLPDRAARMLLDPAFDYLPVRRSAAAREEPVERLLAEAQAALAAGEPDAARRLLEGAVEAARSRRDGMALARAARMVQSALGDFDRGDALLDEALGYPDVARAAARESRVTTIRACARFARGYPLDALDLLRRAVALGRQDTDAVRSPGQIALGDNLMLMGRLDEGAELIVDAAQWGTAMATTVAGVRGFEHGEVEGGLADVIRGTDQLLLEFDFDPLGRAVTATHVLRPRALAELHGGRPQAALLTVERLETLAPEPFNEAAADLAYVRARAGLGLADAAALATAADRIGDLARVASGPAVMGVLEAVRGFQERAAGRRDEASRRLSAAAALCEQAPRAVLAAELWCEAARSAATARAATAALERARHVCAEYGLGRVAAQVAELRRAPAPAVLAELTARERDVVMLAAEGLSNREIGARLHLAEGTVRNYLATAFPKLSVTRRAELGRLVAGAQPTA